MKFTYDEGTYDFNGEQLHYSSLTKDMILTLLKKDPKIIIEFGSWDGGDGIRFKQYFPDCKIHSIEADPSAFPNVKNKEKYGIFAHNHAITSYNGETKFYTVETSEKKEWCSGSVLQHTHIFERNFKLKERPFFTVPCITIEEFCKRNNIAEVDVMQIDTEGYICPILKNMGNIKPKLLFIEILNPALYTNSDTPNQVIELTNQMGYNYEGNNGVDYLFGIK